MDKIKLQELEAEQARLDAAHELDGLKRDIAVLQQQYPEPAGEFFPTFSRWGRKSFRSLRVLALSCLGAALLTGGVAKYFSLQADREKTAKTAKTKATKSPIKNVDDWQRVQISRMKIASKEVIGQRGYQTIEFVSVGLPSYGTYFDGETLRLSFEYHVGNHRLINNGSGRIRTMCSSTDGAPRCSVE